MKRLLFAKKNCFCICANYMLRCDIDAKKVICFLRIPIFLVQRIIIGMFVCTDGQIDIVDLLTFCCCNTTCRSARCPDKEQQASSHENPLLPDRRK